MNFREIGINLRSFLNIVVKYFTVGYKTKRETICSSNKADQRYERN